MLGRKEEEGEKREKRGGVAEVPWQQVHQTLLWSNEWIGNG